MVWIIKKGVFTLLSSEYRHWARTVNSLKAWFTRATQMQMQEPTTFIRQNQTQGRQNTQEQSRTVKLFPRWRSRVKLILRVLKGRKKYLFNATENIRLYGIQFIWLYLLFIFFIVIHTVFLSLGSFAKSFQARIYLHNVYHKAPYISLYYLLISRLNRGGMEPMEPVFFYYPCVCICVCVSSVHMCEMQTQAQMKANENETFSISCFGAYVCFDVVHTCIFLFLRLHLRRTYEPGLRHNPSFTSLYCRTLQRTLVVSRTKFWWHTPERIFPSGQERCLRNPGSSEAECSSDGERKAQATVK